MRAEEMTLWERLTDERFIEAVLLIGGPLALLLLVALVADRRP